jgi:hypothetical protein
MTIARMGLMTTAFYQPIIDNDGASGEHDDSLRLRRKLTGSYTKTYVITGHLCCYE